MRIGIINEEAKASETLRKLILAVSGYEVLWQAENGQQGIQKCQENTPDLVLLSMILSGVDSAKITRHIMQHCPCAILLMTSNIPRNASIIFEAMGYGALDVVIVPEDERLTDTAIVQIFWQKIATIGILVGKSRPNPELGQTLTKRRLNRRSPLPPPTLPPPLVAIGSSTGGPKALATILSQLPASLPCAIVIIQHVDAQFATGLAHWLNAQSPLSVELAVEGSSPSVGKVLLAATNDHLRLQADLTLIYSKDPQNYPYRPSVDVFCQSLAQHWHRKGIGILLTGMGRDGAQGLVELRAKGWFTIAQNQSTCVVYGMPKAAVERQAVDALLPLEAIAPELLKRLSVNG